MLTVIVCGSRHERRVVRVKLALDVFRSSRADISHVIHGGASGVDTTAGRWAEEMLLPCTVVPAMWSRHGKSAGPCRNAQMLAILRRLEPCAVLAFPGGRGTENMVSQALAAGVTVWRCELTDKGGVWRLEGARQVSG